MRNAVRLTIVAAWLGLSVSATAEEAQPGRERAKLEEAARAMANMRENYAYVLRKEQAAKAQRNPLKLNAFHQLASRITELIDVADQSFNDLRVSIAAHEPSEATDAELEKILLLRDKVQHLRDEADRSDASMTQAGGTIETDDPGLDVSQSSLVGEAPMPPMPPVPPVPPTCSRPPPPASPSSDDGLPYQPGC